MIVMKRFERIISLDLHLQHTVDGVRLGEPVATVQSLADGVRQESDAATLPEPAAQQSVVRSGLLRIHRLRCRLRRGRCRRWAATPKHRQHVAARIFRLEQVEDRLSAVVVRPFRVATGIRGGGGRL